MREVLEALRRQRTRLAFYSLVALLLAGAVFFRHELLRAFGAKGWEHYRSVREVASFLGPDLEADLRPLCEQNGVAWPPDELVLLSFKQEKLLEAWAVDESGHRVRLGSYPILGMSGTYGPKRRSGDQQSPEGFYALGHLNANSAHHLSLEVVYPNDLDLAHAQVPRDRMGGQIYIHGGAASIGCIAVGDRAIEEVFTLAALADRRRAILSPVDFRRPGASAPEAGEPWIEELYGELRKALEQFPGEDSSAGEGS